jgi:class 3 adenylate cyclase
MASAGTVDITAFVADLVGSTSLGERLDVEDLAAVVGAAVAAVVLAVESHGGEVLQLAGDGVMARFVGGDGAAMAAVRAGVAASDLVIEQGGTERDRVAVRVGIESGFADAADDLFDLATALEAAAPADGVLAGPVIRRRLRGQLDWQRGDDVSAPDGSSIPSWRPHLADDVAAPPTAATSDADRSTEVREERKVIAALFVATPADGSHGDHVAAEVRRIIERYEGTARTLTGGVTVAFFGVPAHEDDAERAVRAGLEALHTAPGTRAGATVGPAALVLHGAGHHVEFTALGDVMNTAARLMAAAGSGELLCHSGLHERVHHLFAVADRRQLTLKGKAEPVDVVVVGDERDRPVLAAGEAPLVGRHREISHLESWIETVFAGGHGIAVVEGDAGVGKSAVLAEVCATAAAHGADVLTGATASHAHTLPYWPLRHVAAALLDDDRSTSRHAQRSGLALVAGRVRPEGRGAVDVGSADALHEQAVQALVDTLRDRSIRQPVLVVVEDLHWADPWTVAALEAVADVIPVLVTRRPVTGHASQDLVDRARADGTALGLEPLSSGQDRALVDAFFGRAVLPADLEEQILELAHGNPLFLGELCRHLVDQSTVVRDAAGWRFNEIEELNLPDTVQRVILSRADRLPPSVRAVLDAAAVVSGGLDIQVLRHIVGDESTDPALAELRRAALLGHDGQRVWFTHAVVAEAIASTMLRRDRRRIHARAARAFAALRADVPDLWGTLAWHAAEGGDAELAFCYAEPAAEHATARLAFEQAARHYELALRVGAEVGVAPADRVGLLLALGRQRHAAGLLAGALDAYEQAAELAVQLCDRHGVGLAALGHEAAYFATRRPRTGTSGALLRRALNLVDDPTSRAQLLGALATDRAFAGEEAESKRLADEALALARSLDDPGVLAAALHAWRMTRGAPDETGERLLATIEMEETATQAGDGAMALEAGRLRLLDELTLGRMAVAHATIHRVEALAEGLGQPRYLWYPAMWRAMWHLHRGELEDADEHIEAFREEGRRRRYADTETVYAAQLFLLRREQGRCREVDPLIQTARRRGDAVVPYRYLPVAAALDAELGRTAEARDILDHYVAEDFSQVPSDQSAGIVVAVLADACAAIDHGAAAEGLYNRARPWRDQHIVVGSGAVCIGAGAHVLGVLAAVLGRWTDAADHFRDAYEANKAAESPLLAGRSAAEAALALHRLGEAHEASRYLSLARTHATHTSSVRLARRIAHAQRSLWSDDSTRASRSDPSTQEEN